MDPTFQNLHDDIVRGCETCGGSGWLQDETPCECFVDYSYCVVCSFLGYDLSLIEKAPETKFSADDLDFQAMKKRNLAAVLIGNREQTSSYICKQIHRQIDLFTRLVSAEHKWRIQEVGSELDIQESDVSVAPLMAADTFDSAELYKNLHTRSGVVLLTIHLDESLTATDAHVKRANVLFRKTGIMRPMKVIDLSQTPGFDPWRTDDS